MVSISYCYFEGQSSSSGSNNFKHCCKIIFSNYARPTAQNLKHSKCYFYVKEKLLIQIPRLFLADVVRNTVTWDDENYIWARMCELSAVYLLCPFIIPKPNHATGIAYCKWSSKLHQHFFLHISIYNCFGLFQDTCLPHSVQWYCSEGSSFLLR